MTTVAGRPLERRPWAGVGRSLPGLLVAAALAVAAEAVGGRLPLLGGPVAGIVIGVVLSPFARRRGSLGAGTRVAGRHVLQVAVVLLGAQLSLAEVAAVGVSSLPVMVGTLAACLLTAHVVGRWWGIEADLRTLIGVGTGICGASAIAAVTPVIRARSTTVAYAIATIFCFNIAAVLLFPLLGHLLGLSQDAFGLFAGTAVNDTSSVVAAASAYGPEAADHAIVVKLTRTLMIIPICIALSALTQRRLSRTDGQVARRPRVTRLVPWFLVGFLIAAGVNSAGVVSPDAHDVVARTAVYLITVALVAIGLSTDFAAIRRTGPRPLLLGAVLWVVVTLTSLLLQAAGA
ncbi:MAG: YeiH family protein [Marmoricola sp.]